MTEHGADVLVFSAYPFVIYDRTDKFVQRYEIAVGMCRH